MSCLRGTATSTSAKTCIRDCLFLIVVRLAMVREAQRRQGKYLGAPYSSSQTLERRELSSYKRMRLEQHRIRTDKGVVIDDWLWVDTPDMVNVVVERAEDGKLLLFRQTKYGFEGDSLAVVGGLVDDKGRQYLGGASYSEHHRAIYIGEGATCPHPLPCQCACHCHYTLNTEEDKMFRMHRVRTHWKQQSGSSWKRWVWKRRIGLFLAGQAERMQTAALARLMHT